MSFCLCREMSSTTKSDKRIVVSSYSTDPLQAYERLYVSQHVAKVTPLDPATPICKDKIRFVCLSDTHSMIEDRPQWVPAGDVLIHAGDITPIGMPRDVDAFNTFLGKREEREREMFYLTTHSTHFIYGYMASDIWLRTILIVRKETHCRHIGYSFRLTARVLLYAPSHRQDNTYHGLCYTSRGALAGMRNSSMGPPHEGSIRRPTAP